MSSERFGLVGQVVLAEWLDSHQWPGWHTGEPAVSAVRCFLPGCLSMPVMRWL